MICNRRVKSKTICQQNSCLLGEVRFLSFRLWTHWIRPIYIMEINVLNSNLPIEIGISWNCPATFRMMFDQMSSRGVQPVPTCCVRFRMAVNVTQHKSRNLLKTLWDFFHVLQLIGCVAQVMGWWERVALKKKKKLLMLGSLSEKVVWEVGIHVVPRYIIPHSNILALGWSDP